jgi:hypothetical protein
MKEATVVSPMLISEPVAQKLEGLLVEKRKQVVDERAVVMHGRPICVDKPTQSIIALHCHWHRGSSSMCDVPAFDLHDRQKNHKTLR